MAFDFKKEYKEFYMPKNKPEIVTVPKANYIAVRGKGNPNEEGGGFAAIVGLCAKGTGASMIPGMLLYLQGGMIEYIIVLLLSVGVAFAGTWLIMKKNPEAV